MANLDIGPKLEEVGGLIGRDINADADGAFLYAELGDGWIESSIFKDMGDVVRFRIPSDDLTDLLLEMAQAEDPDKRWTSIQYDIKDGQFFVAFGYGDVETIPDFRAGRRAALLKQRFGDKPVDYSFYPTD